MTLQGYVEIRHILKAEPPVGALQERWERQVKEVAKQKASRPCRKCFAAILYVKVVEGAEASKALKLDVY